MEAKITRYRVSRAREALKNAPQPVHAAAAVVCGDYEAGIINKKTFAECLFVLAQDFEAFSRSRFYLTAEATVWDHVCDLWDDCAEGECCGSKNRQRWPWLTTLEAPKSALSMAKLHWAKGRPSFVVTDCVLWRDDYTCGSCGHYGHPLEVDHYYPLARGGSNDWENLWTLCKKCNREKGIKSFAEYAGNQYYYAPNDDDWLKR